MRDVRMRGFARRADVEEVEQMLASHTVSLPAESVPVLACTGRVLAADVRSEVDVPGFDRSAMDGYALRGEDSFGASGYGPVALALIGESLPGRPFAGRVEAGQAVRIMTGAPVPDGADAVVMAEVCDERDGRVELREPVAPRRNVGRTGEDIAREKGARVLGHRGRPFTPDSIGDALATRELMSHLREMGSVVGGQPPFDQRDRSRFLQGLDQIIQAVKREI